jgi:hypothetical protein
MPRPKVRNLIGLASRAQARATKGLLSHTRVSKATQARYQLAVKHFVTFVMAMEWDHAPSLAHMDVQLLWWIEFRWLTGQPRNLAADTLSGCQYVLRSRNCFSSAWQLITVWSRHEPPMRAPTMPPLILLALVGFALSEGELNYALGFLLSYHCMLRTGEALLCNFAMDKDWATKRERRTYRNFRTYGWQTSKSGPRPSSCIAAVATLRTVSLQSLLCEGGRSDWHDNFWFHTIQLQTRWSQPRLLSLPLF